MRAAAQSMWFAALAGGALVGWFATGARADDRAAAVVARAGTAVITVGDVERRLHSVPDFQLATFGDTPRERVRRFVEQVVARDVTLAEEAKAQNLEQAPGVRERVAQALRRARVEELRRNVVVSPEEVAAFFAQNHARFEAPERIGVYRILCASEDEAKAVLAEAKSASGLAKWTELARERSLDKATKYRSGNLGFLAEDGSSNEVSVKTDPKLFAAARLVRDGELVAAPVVEGDGFAVVWRRGSMPAVHRSVEEESNAIRQVLERQKAERALAELLSSLRRLHPVETNPDLIDGLEVDAFGEVAVPKRPQAPAAPRGASSPALTPSATLRGLR